MTRSLSRLLNPKSIAVIGGGAWCAAIIGAARQIGFRGDIFPVHPSGKKIAGLTAIKRLEDWPGKIDAAFIGINRHATIEAVKVLRGLGAGGAVCFASGFTEAAAEDASGRDLQARLVAAADEMPILGPNCYGFLNALDGVGIWPDQHGCTRVDSGVAILTQSSNMAINLTMQQRGLPIAFVATCGNMAQISQAELAEALLEDDRITAIGLHIEGFSDLRAWERFAAKAWARSVPVVALKVGVSDQAKSATVSHTASLAGSDAGAQALLDRLGFPRVHDLPGFLETLKLLHMSGPLPSNRLASISCSGGEASLMADTAHGHDVVFPPLNNRQRAELGEVLGPMVALANPLDYHTYIWRDTDAMTKAWAAMVDPDIALTMSVVDYPVTDAGDWDCTVKAAIGAHQRTGGRFAIVSSLPELMPQRIADELEQGGVAPLYGLREAITAAEAAAAIRAPVAEPLQLPGEDRDADVLTEAEAKAELQAYGLDIPQSLTAVSAASAAQCARTMAAPLVLKGLGIAHKSEAGAVQLGLNADEIEDAVNAMPCEHFLVEEMITGGVAELLIGVTRDPAHGFVLTLAAGGVLTELLADSVSLLVPSSRECLKQSLTRLKTWPLLTGFRGRPAANLDAILDAAEALQAYVLANADTLSEAEINPLICTPARAVAADALIRKASTP